MTGADIAGMAMLGGLGLLVGAILGIVATGGWLFVAVLVAIGLVFFLAEAVLFHAPARALGWLWRRMKGPRHGPTAEQEPEPAPSPVHPAMGRSLWVGLAVGFCIVYLRLGITSGGAS